MKKFQRAIALVAMTCSLGVILRAQSIGPVPAIVNGGRLDRRLIQQAYKVLTNAQILALWSTPVTIIPAQGTGTITEVVGGVLSFAETGTYSSVSGNNLKLYYTSRWAGNAATPTMTMLGFLDTAASAGLTFEGTPSDEIAAKNAPIVLQNVNGVAFGGGNAANTLTIRVNFIVYNQ